MASHPYSLADVQRWMLAVITHPSGVEVGLDSNEARGALPVAAADVEQVIERSRHCTSVERLAVYSHAYFGRLLECLRADYEVTAQAAGSEAFDSLCLGYLQAQPPRSYTLGLLGAGLPDYLRDTRPPRAPDQTAPDWADFLIDLARLERLYTEVFDGPGNEGEPALAPETLRSMTPEAGDRLRIRTAASLRLVSLQFPVHEYLAAVRAGENPPCSLPAPTELAVFRTDYRVRRLTLTPAQTQLLSALQAGESLVAALSRAFKDDDPATEVDADIGQWFRDWTAQGIFRAVQLG